MLKLENLYLFLYALPLYQLLFYTIQLATLKKTNPSRYFMGLLLLNLTAVLGLNALFHLGLTNIFFASYAIFTPLILLILPSFFLYVYTFITSFSTTRSSRVLMLSPSIAMLAFNFIFYISETSFRQNMLIPMNELLSLTSLWEFSTVIMLRIILPLAVLVQVVLAFIKIHRIIETEKGHLLCCPGCSNIAKFDWIYILFISIIVSIAIVLLPFVFPLNEFRYFPLVSNLLLLVSTGLIGYFGLTKNKLSYVPEVFEDNVDLHVHENEARSEGKEIILPVVSDVAVHKNNKTVENGNPLISAEEAGEIIAQLYSLMEEKKPYLDPNYSMSDLCSQMNIDRRKISYVLNNELSVNFYGIINEFRMKDAIHYIENDGQKYTIDAIAQMVGFNSKSSFYTCFKKHTGHTPKEYLSKKEVS